jgi:colanic acid biosynthesis glycosyl transferase WcaI
MKILVVNQTFYPDEVAVSQYLTDLVTDLKKSGHDVFVIAGKRDYENPVKRYPAYSRYNGIEILRVGSTGFSKKNRIGRLVNFITFNMNLFFNLAFINKNNYDCIFGSTVPPMIAVIISIWAKIKNIPFVFWVMDLQPDEAIAAGYLQKKSFFNGIVEFVGKIPLQIAETIIVLDCYMQERLIEKNILLNKIHVCNLWPIQDQDTFTYACGATFRINHNFQDKFVVMYSGNHSLCHPFDTLLKAACFLENNKNILFVFIGGGVRTEEIRKTNARNIVQIPYQPRARLSESLCSADVHIVIMGNEFVGLVHPSKIYGTMACGRPTVFIGPNQCHVADFIQESNSGFIVNHGDVNRLVEVILQLNNMSKEERFILGERASKFIYSRHSRKNSTENLISLMVKK